MFKLLTLIAVGTAILGLSACAHHEDREEHHMGASTSMHSHSSYSK
jgi:hypothetical protein